MDGVKSKPEAEITAVVGLSKIVRPRGLCLHLQRWWKRRALYDRSDVIKRDEM